MGNITTLNTTTLDGNVIIKKGGGSTPTPDTPSAKPKWTGHADAEGLKAIGWTDEDIAYYQENGVNWNEEDDEYHKVTDDNKALYGVLTASNISTYKDRIVYLPKIDTSGVTVMNNMFSGCTSLTAIPMLDTSKVTVMSYMFRSCFSLTSIPQLDTSKVTNMNNMFLECFSLTAIPMLDTSKVTVMNNMFDSCHSLTSIPQLDTSKVTNNREMFSDCYSLETGLEFTSNAITSSGNVYAYCYALKSAPFFNKTGETSYYSSDFGRCYSLCFAQIYGAKINVAFTHSQLLTKDSLLFVINNEAATSAITIWLASYAYDRWATDPDIVAALANHPNITLAK